MELTKQVFQTIIYTYLLNQTNTGLVPDPHRVTVHVPPPPTGWVWPPPCYTYMGIVKHGFEMLTFNKIEVQFLNHLTLLLQHSGWVRVFIKIKLIETVNRLFM